MKIAFITGINGQDGSYLSELLIEKEYKVYGIIRRASLCNTKRINHLLDKLDLSYGDITDLSNIILILEKIKKENPDFNILEIYNLAAQSHVKISFEIPVYTTMTDAIGTLNMLEAIRVCNLEKKCKLYQASTSELFGKIVEKPQTESTPFYPRSPYGVAKLYSYWIIKNYREAYGIHASNGILFNHGSPRRGENFVERKITKSVAEISLGKREYFTLGNINSKRDWSHAKDCVYAQWLILQQNAPDDYVISSNKQYTIKYCVECAFRCVNIEIEWKGKGLNEIGVDKKTNKILIKIDIEYFRPSEVEDLLGDSSHARKKLGWKPKYTFEELIKEMVEYDIYNIKQI
jgi:GDPmannose 4,6-dehydratase